MADEEAGAIPSADPVRAAREDPETDEGSGVCLGGGADGATRTTEASSFAPTTTASGRSSTAGASRGTGRPGGYPGTVEELKNHYQRLSGADRLRRAAAGADREPGRLPASLRKDVKGALPFFRWNAELYPESPNVHDSLGEALETSGGKRRHLAELRESRSDRRRSAPIRASSPSRGTGTALAAAAAGSRSAEPAPKRPARVS